jgi:hypothetical protein
LARAKLNARINNQVLSFENPERETVNLFTEKKTESETPNGIHPLWAKRVTVVTLRGALQRYFWQLDRYVDRIKGRLPESDHTARHAFARWWTL